MRTALSILFTLAMATSLAAAPAWVAYHDRTESDHLSQVAALGPQGYRMISISTYGTPAAPRYAAVWVKRNGPEWKEFHGLTLAQFQARFDSESASGFKLSMIAAAGSAPNARFSGVFEKTPGLVTIYPITYADFEAENLKQKKSNRMLRAAIDFGPAGTPMYIGIWEPNPKAVAWNVGYDLTPEDDQLWFDAEKAQWARPSFSTRTAHGRYISIYRDDQVGPWEARGEMTADGYQAEVEALKAKGFYPMCVQAGGQGSGVRFTAIFVKSETPVARVWSPPSGQAVPQLATLEAIVRNHMVKNGVRAGAVAIARNGKLVYARGFTYAEPGYPQTTPTSMFRIASCSKPLTSIAIHQLIEEGKLSLNDTVQGILQTKPVAGSMDARYDDIKVWHLLSHLGGRYHGPDLPNHFDVRDAVKKPFAMTRSDLIAYQAGRPLDFTPGAKPWKSDYYSNLGYMLLGEIVAKKRGFGYGIAMNENVWKKVGVTRPKLAQTLVTQRWPGEVRYHDRSGDTLDLRVAWSVMKDDGGMVPLAYGGENYATFGAFGGWVVAAPDYAKLLASFDLADNPLFKKDETVKTMWSTPAGYETTNPDLMRGWFAMPVPGKAATQYTHGGSTPGVSTFILHRTDGISIVAFFNGLMDWIEGDLNVAANAVSSWPAHDLFPQVGIPTFQSGPLAQQTKLAKAFSAPLKRPSFPEIESRRRMTR